MTRPRVLLDIDGVCANFVNPVLDLVREVTGTQHKHDDVTEWDIMAALGVSKEHSAKVFSMIRTPGFCRAIPMYPGAKDGVARLREMADVYPVTSPFGGPYWIPEREAWLVEELGFNKNDIVHTAAKHIVTGDVIIDDKTSTLVTWREHNPLGTPVLFSRKYNENDGWNGVTSPNWDSLVSIVRDLL